MKRFVRLVIPVVLVICMSFQLIPVARATDGYKKPKDDIVPRGGDLVLPPHIRDEGSTVYNSLFTMYANEVHNSLFSSAGNKSFRLCDLPSSATKIYLSGTLYHSIGSETPNYRIYVGICYYNNGTNQYVSLYQEEFRHGVTYECPDLWVYVSDLRVGPNYEYEELFAYIRNDHPGGTTYVWGNLTVSYN